MGKKHLNRESFRARSRSRSGSHSKKKLPRRYRDCEQKSARRSISRPAPIKENSFSKRSQNARTRPSSRRKHREASKEHVSRRSRHDSHRRHENRSRSRSHIQKKYKREEAEPSRFIGIFGVNILTSERRLKKVFSEFGAIDDLYLVYDKLTGISRGFGFCTYETEKGAARAMKYGNSVEIDGRSIRVDYSTTKRPRAPTPGNYMGKRRNVSHKEGSRRERHSSQQNDDHARDRYRARTSNPCGRSDRRYGRSRSPRRNSRRS